jgi:hypothetical protein
MTEHDTTPAPSPTTEADGTDDKSSFVGRQVDRGKSTATRMQDWVTMRRDVAPSVDLAVQLYERDRETFASVLGSAIALRLFLFFVPIVVAVVGFIQMVMGSNRISQLLSQANIKGGMAAQIASATRTSKNSGFLIFAGGLLAAIWAGRSLTRVLAACAAGSWQLGGVRGKATLKMAGMVTGLLFAMVVIAAVINRIRVHSGVALAATSLLVVAVVYAGTWFVVTWTLPRGTPDPGALLPGAAVVGIGMALLQAFMQFYLPDKIARSSHTMGSIGVAVAVLGYLFFFGRLLAASFVLDAVVYEKFGSISEVVFALPFIRRIPRRWPRVARFFDLADVDEQADQEPTQPDAA